MLLIQTLIIADSIDRVAVVFCLHPPFSIIQDPSILTPVTDTKTAPGHG